MACILAKLVKREMLNDPAEFNLQEMDDRFGMHMAGVVGKYDFKDAWQLEIQMRCLQKLENLAREGSTSY